MPQDGALRDLTAEELEELQRSPAIRDLTQAETDELNLLTVQSLQPTLASEAGRIATQTLEGALALPELVGQFTGAASIIPLATGQATSTEEALQLGRPTEQLKSVGVPIGQRPETEIGRFVGDVGEIAAAGAIPSGLAVRAGAPLGGVVASELGAGLGGAIGERVAGPEGEIAGAIIGSLTPAGLAQLTRLGFRGSKEEAEQAFKTLQEGGVTPTPALIAEGGATRAIASAIRILPGGGKINDAIKGASQQIGQKIDDIIGKGDFSSEASGRVIQRGIAGETGFIKRFKKTAEKLFNKITVPDDVQVSISNTKNILDELSPSIEGAEAVSDLLANPIIRGIREATGEIEELSFEALQKLRSEVGRKLASGDLVSDIPRAELKRLYGALTEDLKVAADAAGLGKEFSRANKFYSAGIKRVDDFLSGIQKKVPEKVLAGLIAGGKEGASQIRAIRRSLKPEEWAVVAKSALKRMGQQTGGQADEFGVGFSSERLLTNLNNMSNEARTAFFGNVKGINQNDINALAKSAAILRRATREGINPSGSAQANAKTLLTSASVGGLAAGSPLPAFMAGLTILGANGTSRLLTSPAFAKWLVRGSKLPASLVPGHIARLSTIAERNPELSQDIQEFIKVLEEQ